MAVAMPSATAAPSSSDGHITTGGVRAADVNWQACPQRPTDMTVRCATIQVPIDWSDPHGPTFGLAIARQAAGDPAADEGPLVINPGGPGISGVDFALKVKQYFGADVLRHFDVVGFDPRGTNRSDPVRCSPSLVNARPFPIPDSPADYARLLAYNAELTANCRAETGAIFDHLDAISVARDIDAIRAVLDAPTISYYGESYGTLFGQKYAELFPNRVRAMALDSNVDHSLGAQPDLVDHAASGEDSFDQFVAWCNRDTSCVLHGRDVPAIWTDLLHRADAGTLTDTTTGHKLTWFDLSETAITALEGPLWSELADGIAQLDTTDSAALPPATAIPPALLCEDWSFPVSGYRQVRRYLAETEVVAPELRTATHDWPFFSGCLGWTGPVPDPQHLLRVHTSVPLLELNSQHDPRTPYSFALDTTAQLGASGRLVTYLGWGHVAYPRSRCTVSVVDSYLVNRTVPAIGASCAAVPPPDQPTPPSARPGQSH